MFITLYYGYCERFKYKIQTNLIDWNEVMDLILERSKVVKAYNDFGTVINNLKKLTTYEKLEKINSSTISDNTTIIFF